MLRYTALNGFTAVVDFKEEICYIIKKELTLSGGHKSYVQAEDSEMHEIESGFYMPYSLDLAINILKWLQKDYPENKYCLFRESKTMLCTT